MTAPRRRNNAPLRPRRRPVSGVPDILFAAATGMLTMGAIFLVASFTSDSLSSGDAGTDLARLFAASLALSAILVFMMGLLLLRDDRGRSDHYRVPVLVGVIVGAVESALFLDARHPLALLAVLGLLLFALRPVRRLVSNLFGGRR